MKGIYSLLFGAALGASSIFIHSFYPPVGLVVSLVATGMGIWATGRLWGKRSYKSKPSNNCALVAVPWNNCGTPDIELAMVTPGLTVVNPGIAT